jgi:hypothetical protein
MALRNADKKGQVEYITPTIGRMNFPDVKHYLTKEVVPQAIMSYAEECIADSDNERPTGSLLDRVCVLAQKSIDNGLSILTDAISEYKKKHGYSDYCESVENTQRLWENSKLKLLDEAYFEEIIVDSLKNIENGSADFELSSLSEETAKVVKRVMEEIKFELNRTHYLPKTDQLSRLKRG